MIFVDSSVWIDYFNGNSNLHTDFLDSLLESGVVCLGDYVLLEVLQGFKEDRAYNTALRALSSFPVYSIGGTKMAIKSAKNFRFLRKQGITIRKTVDVIIATFCIQHNFELLHKDKDYLPFEKYLRLRSCIPTDE
ncbi:MAG: PIN domain nuclease [Ignavibacteriales bacterium]|nr:MAG: PIN domain nuclease [Ignavibacteriales bacterium]